MSYITDALDITTPSVIEDNRAKVKRERFDKFVGGQEYAEVLRQNNLMRISEGQYQAIEEKKAEAQAADNMKKGETPPINE
ncbi:Uncharacterised protein [uncultured archaeon]|nr:Uncharacterised protein [uncultured archaeon]